MAPMNKKQVRAQGWKTDEITVTLVPAHNLANPEFIVANE